VRNRPAAGWAGWHGSVPVNVGGCATRAAREVHQQKYYTNKTGKKNKPNKGDHATKPKNMLQNAFLCYTAYSYVKVLF
jgi:hypothetical protein